MRPSLAIAIAATLLAGCSSLPKREKQPTPSQVPSDELVQARQLAGYVAALQTLVQGNDTAKAEVMNSARAVYEGAKAGPAALRYGLLLATPGHPLRNPVEAQRVLQEALARPELLGVTERALGKVELARVESELRLVAEIDRLVQQERERTRTATANAALNNTALNKRLQTEIEESARLRKALDEAKAKLEAITRMERNFSDRPPAPEGRNQ